MQDSKQVLGFEEVFRLQCYGPPGLYDFIIQRVGKTVEVRNYRCAFLCVDQY